jgi:hypothetical protein
VYHHTWPEIVLFIVETKGKKQKNRGSEIGSFRRN